MDGNPTATTPTIGEYHHEAHLTSLYRAPNRICYRPYFSACLAAFPPTHPHPCSRLFTHPACCVLAPYVHSLPAVSQTPINYRQLPAATTSTQLQLVPCLACRPAQVCLSLHIEKPALSAYKFTVRYFSPRYCLILYSTIQCCVVLSAGTGCSSLKPLTATYILLTYHDDLSLHASSIDSLAVVSLPI